MMDAARKIKDTIDRADDAKIDEAPIFSEEALALKFASRHASNLRYVALWGKWYCYDGKRWKPDETRNAFSLARNLCREVAGEINKLKEAKAIASAKTRAAVISLAGDDRRLAATIDQWDADPWLLNTPGGVIDLHDGKIRDHRDDDYFTKITSVAPDANCPTPLWDAFLDKVTNHDKELQKFLARMAGYGITGLVTEHALFFLYGTGRNGKGVWMNAMIGIIADYHRSAPVETFTETHSNNHPTELAMLRGARLVTSTETEEGRHWAEARIKMLTGGDKVSARFMRQDFFDYVPQFKLFIAGNHKPGLRSVDEAIKSRVNMVPFSVTIPEEERDKELGSKLVAEYPGILNWMIEGCKEWQRIGLSPPKAVSDATNEYLKAEDSFELWLKDCCDEGPDLWTRVDTLFLSWKRWAEYHGEAAGSGRRLSQRLEAAGYKQERRHLGRGFSGLSTEVPKEEPQGKDQKPKWEESM
jgi:putative DNA primase/helicase